MPGIQIPKTLKDFTVHIEGEGFAGRISQGKPPKITVKTEEHWAGGMDFPRQIDMGLEKMECEFTLAEMNPNVMGKVAIFNDSNTSVKMYGALHNDVSQAADAVEITLNGALHEYEASDWEKGKKTEDKYKMDVKFYQLTVGGKEVFYIDNDNNVRRINGTDQVESIRSAIKM